MSPDCSAPLHGGERRKASRYAVALDVAFGPLGPDGQPQAAAHLQRSITVNLSFHGLCFYSDLLYPVGSLLQCVITLPGRDEPVQLTGASVWFQQVEHEPHGYKLGVEFAELAPETRETLQTLFDQPVQSNGGRAKTLLLADDDDDLRLAVRLRFESVGYRVITACEGLEALRKGREEHPNLINLDLMLPNLNGYEVCRLLKFDQKFQHIPILLFTCRARREDMELGQAVGANAYLTKPFDGRALIAKVEELLQASPA